MKRGSNAIPPYYFDRIIHKRDEQPEPNARQGTVWVSRSAITVPCVNPFYVYEPGALQCVTSGDALRRLRWTLRRRSCCDNSTPLLPSIFATLGNPYIRSLRDGDVMLITA